MIELSSVALLHPRGGRFLVSDATLTVAPRQVALIVAAAGSGSSRLLSAILGETPCENGGVTLLGREVGKLRRASLRVLRRRIGIVPQDLCLLEERSAQLNVVMPLEIDGVPRSQTIGQAAAALQAMELTDEASLPVELLSRSARQRVAVARALVRDPDIVLADQPTSHQDPAGAELVCRAFDRAAARGAACLVIGRDPMLRVHAEMMGWSQWLLDAGRLVPLGSGAAADWSLPMEASPELTEEPRKDLNGPSIGDSIGASIEEPFDEFSNVVPFPGLARSAGGR